MGREVHATTNTQNTPLKKEKRRKREKRVKSESTLAKTKVYHRIEKNL